jgi:hypothetical protein
MLYPKTIICVRGLYVLMSHDLLDLLHRPFCEQPRYVAGNSEWLFGGRLVLRLYALKTHGGP